MDYVLLFLENDVTEGLPQLFVVSQLEINHAHESGKMAKINVHPVLIDMVPGGAYVILDRVLWSTAEIEQTIRSAYRDYAVLWESETTIPLELSLVKQKLKQAGYVKLRVAV